MTLTPDDDAEHEIVLTPAERAAARELDEVVRSTLRKLAYRHPHWPAAVRDEIKKECDGELYLVEEIPEYWEAVRLVAEKNAVGSEQRAGIMPASEVWADAQKAFATAEEYFSGNRAFLDLPPELQGLHSALGALLGVHQGYGEGGS